MSGNPGAFRDMLAQHDARRTDRACSGCRPSTIAIDWDQVIFDMLTIKGIYGREMFETWYKMTVLLESGLDLSPVITHRFPIAEYQTGLRPDGCRQLPAR